MHKPTHLGSTSAARRNQHLRPNNGYCIRILVRTSGPCSMFTGGKVGREESKGQISMRGRGKDTCKSYKGRNKQKNLCWTGGYVCNAGHAHLTCAVPEASRGSELSGSTPATCSLEHRSWCSARGNSLLHTFSANRCTCREAACPKPGCNERCS